MRRIPVAGPSITAKEVEYVAAAAREAWYENAGMFHARFESAFAGLVGRAHAIALPSCTSALHLTLAALGVEPGDEVIVPESTWIGTAAPISYLGASPVFADIDPETWCISAESLARCITDRTKAVIVVGLYGNMPDMDAVGRVTDDAGVAIVEDAAQALGSSYRGRAAGSFGVASTFSFHGSKTMTTGEGGMLVTDRDDLHQRVSMLRDHGRPPGDRRFYNTEVAYKYKMSAVQAALGLAQLERLDELVLHKRRIFSWYARELEGVDGLTLNRPGPHVEACPWMVTAVLDERLGLGKHELMDRLAEHGIDSRPFFHPLSSLPAYQDHRAAEGARERNPVAYRVGARGVNLPTALSLDEEQVVYVCDRLRRVLERPR